MNFTARDTSIRALLALLEAAQARPSEERHQAIHVYLHSQAALAKYADPSAGITSCSLNTLKKSCLVIPGGFMALDHARRRALAALDNAHAGRNFDEGTSKRALQARVKKLRQLLQASTEDLLLMTRLLDRSLRYCRQYANDSRNPGLIERCARDEAEMRDMLSLRQVSPPHLYAIDELQ